MPQLCFSRLIPNFGGSMFQDEGSGVISFARPPPAGHGRTPSKHLLSMLEANKPCGNQSTVMLEAPGMGFPVFYDGRVHVRNSSDDGLNVPLKWTLATLKADPKHFTAHSANPFGKKYYLYHNGGDLAATSVADWAGRYSARYTSTLKPPRIALSSTERCVMGDPGNDNVYRLDNSPCKLFACNKIETSGTGHGSGGEPMDAATPSKWYNPVDDSDPICPSTLEKHSKLTIADDTYPCKLQKPFLPMYS
ncbi:hypothetical protein F5B21DRAFT_496101 [Xylaria acuta]|nr:hypothetical protein F5B21DRAFT_496101 [Xylaria acuta]